MAEVVKLLKGLSENFNTLHEDVDNLKKSREKQTCFLVVEVVHQVLGEEHVATLTI